MSANQAGFLLSICKIYFNGISLSENTEKLEVTVLIFEINVQTLLASDS